MFARFATRCATLMGSPRTFAVTVLLIVLWLLPLAWMGASAWNSSVGLAGNTIESTAELVMAIAIQYVVNRSERGQQAAIARIEQLEATIAKQVTEELVLLRKALGQDEKEEAS